MRDDEAPGTSRRTVLAGVCGAGVVAALGGCATYGGSSAEPDNAEQNGAKQNGAEQDDAEQDDATPGTSGPAAGAAALAKVADIPVGGGKVVDRAGTKILIVQPVAGTFKAYNAACTHQGTTVGTPENGVMTCPNHGSKFKAADGSVVNGPAGRPLEKIAVKVTGDGITLA